jgi:hypothetical protein
MFKVGQFWFVEDNKIISCLENITLQNRTEKNTGIFNTLPVVTVCKQMQ